MSRLRVGFLALCAVLLLSAASVSSVSAAPKAAGPDSVDCGGIKTVADSGWFHWAGKPYDTKEIIERQYTVGGGDCDSWRVRTLISTWGVVTGLTIRDNFQMGGNTYFQNTWTNQTLQSGLIYYYGGFWQNLRLIASGCVWSSEGYLSTIVYFYSPYTCVSGR